MLAYMIPYFLGFPSSSSLKLRVQSSTSIIFQKSVIRTRGSFSIPRHNGSLLVHCPQALLILISFLELTLALYFLSALLNHQENEKKEDARSKDETEDTCHKEDSRARIWAWIGLWKKHILGMGKDMGKSCPYCHLLGFQDGEVIAEAQWEIVRAW